MTLTTTAPARPGAESAQWMKCPACDSLVYLKRLERNLRVCPECNNHFRLTPAERLAQLVDPGTCTAFGADLEPVDVLGFTDQKPYPERLAAARDKTGAHDAVFCATARIGGEPVVLAILDFSFMGGSVGGIAGELITRAAEQALESRTPLVIVAASGGARMQEGCVSLMQLAKTSQALARLHEEGILCINLNTHPTYGGATASFAMLGDIILAEPGAHIGFAGPQVIQQTIRQQLPTGFQTAEFLAENGQLDLVLPREALRPTLARLLRLHRERPAPGAYPPISGPVPLTDPDTLPTRPAVEVVGQARNVERPTTLDYVGLVFDEFVELHGDRLFGDDPSLVGGLARLGERTVVVLGHQKGHDTAELIHRKFGMPDPSGYHKARRLMSYAAKFGFPVVTFIDTPGAYPGLEAEQRGQGGAIANCIMHMSRLPVPVVAIVTGEGGSGGALALGVGNRVLMLENAYFSVISPEGCSTILWGTTGSAAQAAEALRVTAPDLLRLGIMDGVVPEPPGGAHTDPVAAADAVKTAVSQALHQLAALPPQDLVEQRHDRFRRFGDPFRQSALTGSICR